MIFTDTTIIRRHTEMDRSRKIKHVKDVFKDDKQTAKKQATRPRVLRHSHSTSSQGSPRMPRSPAGDPRRQLPDLPMHTPDESPVDPSPLTFVSSSAARSPLTSSGSPLTSSGYPLMRTGVPSVPSQSFAESHLKSRHVIVTQQSAPPAMVNSLETSPAPLSSSPAQQEKCARISISSSESEEEKEEEMNQTSQSTSANKRSSFAELRSVFQRKSSTTVDTTSSSSSPPPPPPTHHNISQTSSQQREEEKVAAEQVFTYDCSSYGGDLEATPTTSSSPAPRSQSINLTDAFADDSFSPRSSRVASARAMKPGSTGTAGSTGSSGGESESSTAADVDCIAVEKYPGSEEFGGYLDDDEDDDERLRQIHHEELHRHHHHHHHQHHQHPQRHSLHRSDSGTTRTKHSSNSDDERTSSLLGKLFGRLLKRSSSVSGSTNKRQSIKARNVYNTTYLDSKQGRADDNDQRSIEVSTLRTRRRY